jgi:putative DNA primase/helicase
VSDFRTAMLAAGLLPRDIVPDGRFHRCPTQHKPRKRNGAYLLSIDGQRGVFRDYAQETDWNVWTADGVTNARPDPYLVVKLRQARLNEARMRQQAIAQAREYFAKLPRLAGLHPYLERKKLTARGCSELRLDGDRLAIPLRGVGRDLVSVQTIAPDGSKLYRRGCPTAGASFMIGTNAPSVTCLVEGFATGLAVYQSVANAQVVVCFDAANLLKVVAAIKPRGLVVVCADNDHRNAVNVGLDKGRIAADSLGCGLAYPQGIEGTDFSDLLIERGAQYVRTAVMREARAVR